MPPHGDPHHPEHHVGVGGSHPQQPLRVHRAVGVGGRIPRAFGCVGAVVPGVLEPGGPGRANVACVNEEEVHVRTELASQALAAVVAGVEHNDREYRRR